MTGPPLDLSDLQDFVHVVTHGSFGGASRASGRPKATLSRRIAELETRLGVRLFERGPQRLRLTEAGRTFHAQIEAPLSDIADAAEAASSGAGRPAGVLRVSTPILFGHTYMGRLASAFATLYPEVQLEVVSSDRHVDLVEEGVDVVIRVNPRPEESLTGRRFMTDRLLAVSAHPRPPTETGNSNDSVPAVVLVRSPQEEIWDLTLNGNAAPLTPAPTLRFSSVLMVRDAVYAGAGVALLPRSMVAADVKSGRLFDWGELNDYDIRLWVLHTSRRLVSPKVAAFSNFLVETFKSA